MTTAIVDFLPVCDLLGRDARCEYSVELPVLGVGTRFESNSRYVLGVVDEAFGAWRHVESTGDLHLRVRIVVVDGNEGDAVPAPVRHVCPDEQRLIVHSPGSIGVSDPARGESVAYVTTALAADTAHFRGAMLEALTFALIAQFDRHPLHAAAVARDGRAVLLVGESGAGKSTLAYLASCAGFDVIAEDHAWIQLEPALRVWGGARRVRLGREATTHFPEVASAAVSSTIGGKIKLTVELPTNPRATVSDSAVVCLLCRSSLDATLERVDAGAITSGLMANVSPGFDRFPERHARVVRALAEPGGWRLHLSGDPRQALPLLAQLLGHTA